MPKRLLLIGLLLSTLLLALPMSAQGAPDQIHAALEMLSQNVGTPLQLGDLNNWRWAQESYTDTSFGCPVEGQEYPKVMTLAYRFTLTYKDIVYDYRVSGDSSRVVFCGGTPVDAVETPVAAQNVTLSDESGPVICANPEPGVTYMPTRLTPNLRVRVAPGPPNNQRSEPGTEQPIIGEIPGGAVVTLRNGPFCADGLLWWQADYNGQVGWTVEGRDGNYWLEPAPAEILPADRAMISAANASGLSLLSSAEISSGAQFALSPIDAELALLAPEQVRGVWLYDLDALDNAPRLLQEVVQLLSVSYSPDGERLLLGDTTGNIRVWDLVADADGRMREVTQLRGHVANTRAVAFNPVANIVASVGDAVITTADIPKDHTIILWNLDNVSPLGLLPGHSAPVHALAFSPDGTLLASVSGSDDNTDNTLRLWNGDNGAAIVTLTGHSGPVQSVQFSPDSAFVASADANGTVILWDIVTQEEVRRFAASGEITSVSFSPDGSLLALSSNDTAQGQYTVQVWDVNTGEALATLQDHTTPIHQVAFNANGDSLISLGENTLLFWGVTP